jgi:hypothetical protein
VTVRTSPTLVRTSRPRWALTVALAPFVALVALALGRAGYFDPMFSEPATILGMPADVVVAAAAIAWGALGGVFIWRSSSPLRVPIALLVFTVPACLAILLAPAVVLIVQNL